MRGEQTFLHFRLLHPSLKLIKRSAIFRKSATSHDYKLFLTIPLKRIFFFRLVDLKKELDVAQKEVTKVHESKDQAIQVS